MLWSSYGSSSTRSGTAEPLIKMIYSASYDTSSSLSVSLPNTFPSPILDNAQPIM